MKTLQLNICKIILWIVVAFIQIAIVNAQCNNNTPAILKTFGTSDSLYNPVLPSTFGFSTNYVQYNGTIQNGMYATWDGQFSFVNKTTDPWGNWWGGQPDHTGDVNGNMMLVNADFGPGVFYKDTVQGLCNGITYNLSAWIANLTKNENGINPNIKFEVTDFTDTTIVLGTYTTGDIVANTVKFTWQKYSLSFTSTANKVILKLINSNPGGGGNDLVLDDIAFTPCLPEYKLAPVATQFCSGNDINLNVNYISGSAFADVRYQWQKKVSDNWTNIGGLTVNKSLSILNSTSVDSAWYRVIVANQGNENSPLCRIVDSVFIKVNSTPTVNTVSDQTLCNGINTSAVTITGSTANTIFSWTNDNTSIGLASNGTGDINSFLGINIGDSPQIGNITLTPQSNGCSGVPEQFIYKINPTPSVTKPLDQTVCSDIAFNAISFVGQVNNTVFDWTNDNTSLGLNANGTGDIISFTGIAPNVANVTVIPKANNCVGASQTFKYTVNSIPTVNAVSDQTLCNGINTSAVTITGSTANTIFSWTNDNTSIGLASNGTGDINSFLGINIGDSPQIGNITITPQSNGCSGIPEQFIYKINPTPSVTKSLDQTVCSGIAFNTISFVGQVNNTVFDWTNDNTSLGLTENGTGDIISFTGIAPNVANVTVIPKANNCVGASQTFKYTINSIPTVNTVTDQTLCNGINTSAVTFAGSTANTIFSWTNDNTSIGLASNGIGDINAFLGKNIGDSPQIGNITIVPTLNTCKGAAKIFSYTILPSPKMNYPSDQYLCNRSETKLVTIEDESLEWINNNSLNGLAESGKGSIPSFIATNSSDTVQVSSITISSAENKCVGISRVVHFIVYPTPLNEFVATFKVGEPAVNAIDSVINIGSIKVNYILIKLLNPKPNDELQIGNLPIGLSSKTYFKSNETSIVITGNGTKNEFTKALAQIKFINSSLNPDTSKRIIHVIVNDSISVCNYIGSTIIIIPIKYSPIINNEYKAVEMNSKGEFVTFLINDILMNTTYKPSQIIVTPQHGILDFVNISNGILKYIPENNYIGNDTVIVSICNDETKCLNDTIFFSVIGTIIPTGFSPNNDNVNDTYEILYPKHWGNSSLQVYNRWGSLVYENDNYQNDWNGTSNKGSVFGDALSDGTYFTEIKFSLNKEIEFMIPITLFR